MFLCGVFVSHSAFEEFVTNCPDAKLNLEIDIIFDKFYLVSYEGNQSVYWIVSHWIINTSHAVVADMLPAIEVV